LITTAANPILTRYRTIGRWSIFSMTQKVLT
jgi:hypothetical protein